jgi:FtsH-binding integral membrane protein
MNKFFKILEITWLITALLCACISVYFLITNETDSALYFIFVFIIAGIMYLLRKHQRKTQEKVNAHNAQIKKK